MIRAPSLRWPPRKNPGQLRRAAPESGLGCDLGARGGEAGEEAPSGPRQGVGEGLFRRAAPASARARGEERGVGAARGVEVQPSFAVEGAPSGRVVDAARRARQRLVTVSPQDARASSPARARRASSGSTMEVVGEHFLENCLVLEYKEPCYVAACFPGTRRPKSLACGQWAALALNNVARPRRRPLEPVGPGRPAEEASVVRRTQMDSKRCEAKM